MLDCIEIRSQIVSVGRREDTVDDLFSATVFVTLVYRREGLRPTVIRKAGGTHEVLQLQERIGAWAKSQVFLPLVTVIVPAVAQRTNSFPRQAYCQSARRVDLAVAVRAERCNVVVLVVGRILVQMMKDDERRLTDAAPVVASP